jgi:hypothetical protein
MPAGGAMPGGDMPMPGGDMPEDMPKGPKVEEVD